jgi:16S rRNA G966 N2-methylase RsmD
MRGSAKGALSQKFQIPPFSILNAREGYWQTRKEQWLALGIQSEVGRAIDTTRTSATSQSQKLAPGGGGGGCWLGGPRTTSTTNYGKAYSCNTGDYDYFPDIATGTSVFDPVLCELMYRWFCPHSGTIVDPFAGGSVRGIVAGCLGYSYWGCELRQVQVTANEAQRDILPNGANVTWAQGDATRALSAAPKADFIFSCPPYGNLERYSDDPADLSTMDYPQFVAAHAKIIRRAASKLHNNRFACWVIGEYRNKDGAYVGFVADTVKAWQAAGLQYYNEIILVTAVGSLPIRTANQFQASRKAGKTHQNVLVFCKGSGKQATAALEAL